MTVAHIAEKRILPSKKVNAGVSSREERGPTELYPTPFEATRALLDSGEPIPPVVYEPMCGLGHMAIPIRETGRLVIASDIVDYGWPDMDYRADFFTWNDQTAPIKSVILTNPAFSVSARFVRHALKLCDKVIILNRLAFLEGTGRSDIIDGNLVRVYAFRNRLPMMHRWTKNSETGVWEEWKGKKAPSATAMAWFVFEREKTVATQFSRISWVKSK